MIICQLFIIIFTLTLVQTVNAQSDASTPYFKQAAVITNPGVIDWNATYLIDKSTTKSWFNDQEGLQLTSSSPKKVKEIKGTLKLRRGKTCIEIACASKSDCGSCKMFWADRNGDGKVQPRKELRCVCTKGKQQCGLRARKIRCR